MERHVLLQLRIAKNTDFSDDKGVRKQNIPYFCKNSIGVIEPKMYMFNSDTDIISFKELYACNQIYVFTNSFEVVATVNCIDWELVEKELAFELQELEKLKKVAS